MSERLEVLVRKVQALKAEGRLRLEFTHAEKVGWAYGNAVIENPSITRELVDVAARRVGRDESR